MSDWGITFEQYLIMVGKRSETDYTYEDDVVLNNVDYFKKCYNDHLSAYKALLFLHDHLEDLKNVNTQS